MTRTHWIVLLAATLLLAAFPMTGSTFYTQLLTKTMILAIFAIVSLILLGTQVSSILSAVGDSI